MKKTWLYSMIGALLFTITFGLPTADASASKQDRLAVNLEASTSVGQYQIVDTDGKIYTYTDRQSYEAAEQHFKAKWAIAAKKVVGTLASDYATESYEHRGFGGWSYTTPVGYSTNFNNSKYNDEISSIKTARRSSGTKVCYHKNGGEPCKTFGPGLDISYVGNGWNDQISYVNVYR
ncbi:hypothetical protein [Thermoactinomyces sp. DSM 45892]|uniref:hypothetical protein n=1 Tax=Thermoactinomyces sp. DSM 45892 TaxID=1882753 RepID=UPI0008981928|nr:hypothetical protein [Thermoactinomyces sp. DSM 45892]SDZ16881.1 hypothetical protein SAMN05444416_11530 [Thermoactinomyces sp. DSM 45892]